MRVGGLRRPERRQRRIDFDEQSAIEVETRCGVARGDGAPHEQGADDQQGQRQPQLRRQHEVPRAEDACRPAQGRPVLAPQGIHDGRPAHPPGGPEGEGQRGHGRPRQRDGQHAPVRRRIELEGHRRHRRQRLQQSGCCPLREQRAEGGAAEGEQEPLHQQLPDDGSAAGAEGQPDGHFRLAVRTPREQQVREVEAGDDQHDARHGHQHDRHGPQPVVRTRDRANARPRQRGDDDGLVAVLGRIGGGEPRGDAGQFPIRRLARRAVTQPGDEHQFVGVAAARRDARAAAHVVVLEDRRGTQGQPDLGRDDGARPGEPLRGHAHHGERLVVDEQRAADETGITAHLSPVEIRHHADRRRAPRRLFVVEERPAHGRRHAHRLEEVRGHHRDKRAADQVPFGEAHHRDLAGRHGRQRCRRRADVRVVGVRERPVPIRLPGVPAVEPDQLAAGRRPGQRPHQQRVDDRVDRGVGADAEPQHHDGNRREGRVAAEPSTPATHCLPETAHASSSGFTANGLRSHVRNQCQRDRCAT